MCNDYKLLIVVTTVPCAQVGIQYNLIWSFTIKYCYDRIVVFNMGVRERERGGGWRALTHNVRLG